MRYFARLVVALAPLLCGLFFAACSRSEPTGRPKLVLYVSADDALYRPLLADFERQTRIRVSTVGDTEATKTFGLVRRLLDEQSHPQADLFWASEPLGMIRLARANLLKPLADDRRWLPLAYRARVIVYHTGRIDSAHAPRRLGDLLDPELKGKIGLARPQFGTTRTHMAALLAEFGEERYLQFLRALKSNGARIYDGNSMVVQAVAQGEISAGLTDSDDVASGKAERWPIDWKGGTAELAASPPGDASGAILLMPHVIGIIKREDASPDRLAAQDSLVAFLRSPSTQKAFVDSGAALCGWDAVGTVPGPIALPDYANVAADELRAVELFEKVWAEP